MRSAARCPPRAPRARAARRGAEEGGTLKFARSIAPTKLDPANTIIAGDIYTLDKIFEPLFITSPPASSRRGSRRATRVSKDNKTFTFDLRPGVKFSDGKPLTPADVVFSINRARTDKNGPLSFLDFAIKSLEAKGLDQVVAQLSAPWAPFVSDISAFANAILPANFGGESEKAFFDNPIGTGPFTTIGLHADGALDHAEQEPAVLAGRQAVPRLRQLHVRRRRQPAGPAAQGRPGRRDRHVPPSQVASLNRATRASTSLWPAWQVDLLVLNEKLPQFADRNVRRAITHAIDRNALVAAASFGTAKPGGSFFPPSLEYYSATTPALDFNVAQAKAELAKSQVPERVQDQAADRRRRAEVASSPRSSSSS